MRKIYTETIQYTDYATTWTYPIDLEGIKEEINQLKMEIDIYTILAYIYDLFQNDYISEDIEEELYTYVDPKDKYNEYSPAECWWDECWWDMETNYNPLVKYCS
jgi:hypothetical protein